MANIQLKIPWINFSQKLKSATMAFETPIHDAGANRISPAKSGKDCC